MQNTPETLLQACESRRLSAWDNVRYLVSVLTLQGEQAKAFEAQIDGKPHYLLQALGVCFDCGRSNSYQVQIRLLTDTEFTPMKVLDITPLSAEQLSYLCMETAHFDHCY
ncbi:MULTISPECIES: hypothetical protein [Shewanella]|uniref:hypothetical protein n=1 Tax=Shewanella TaxID=22 RepID=UPI0011821868|nr:hypothetical protein [Shewanella algae]EKT4488927.1 hypothetical protein [Shewanella algae]MBO2546733.1 hypothetical protein [Shewanella algae]MBO2615101.1 hypothetical protein [Shewanella algae]MBO2627559.1 hypothetical protein [Shewanella algae]MBO2661332.1 hypothetical protein [Shewanella algae]